VAAEDEYGELSNYALGAYATPAPIQPQRTWGQALGDTAKDLGAGFVDLGRAGAGVVEQTQRAFDPSVAPTGTHQWMDRAADLSGALRADKSAGGRYLDEHGGPSFWREPATYATHVAAGMVPYAGLIPLGVWGAPVAGALAGGMEAWRKEGRPVEQGLTGVMRPPDDVVPAGPDRGYADMINYLRWEEKLGHKYAPAGEAHA